MGKKYYCDYCDKSFADNPTSRRNHLKGGIHHRLKRQHYEAFNDAATILAEALAKPPCKQFQHKGECKFGENCKFSHLTPAGKRELEENAREQQNSRRARKKVSSSCPEPNLEDWLAKRVKRLSAGKERPATSAAARNKVTVSVTLPEYKLAPCLQTVPNLPPSVLPPTTEDITHSEVEKWG